jgi:hypothetical protein
MTFGHAQIAQLDKGVFILRCSECGGTGYFKMPHSVVPPQYFGLTCSTCTGSGRVDRNIPPDLLFALRREFGSKMTLAFDDLDGLNHYLTKEGA